MTNLEKIEQDVQKLSPEELAAFREWFHAHEAAAWDRQIERDVRSGNLESLWREAIGEDRSRSGRRV